MKKPTNPAVEVLKRQGATVSAVEPVAEPLWAGPCDDGPNGGVTYSMLTRFMACRERFRIQTILGLRPPERFQHRIEYGNMWHVCEETYAASHEVSGKNRLEEALTALKQYARGLAASYPLEQGQIDHWYRVCKLQFPLYVIYWSKHPHATGTPLLQEEVFNVPLRLSGGHVVHLRGKFDSVDYVASPTAEAGIWLQENKTKGDIEEEDIARQLTMDLQTMMYLTALYQYASNHPLRDAARRAGAGDAVPLVGVRYNVVRRPLSGGKGSIVRHKPTKKNPRGESLDEYYERVASYIREEPGRYFMRWQAIVNRGEVVRFRQQVLDPLLTQLCIWYEVVTQSHRSRTDPFVEGNGVHWRHPYGVRNPIDEGYAGDVDSYLENGSRVGLVRAETLFPELQPPPTGGAV